MPDLIVRNIIGFRLKGVLIDLHACNSAQKLICMNIVCMLVTECVIS